MIRALVHFSLKYRLVVVSLACVLLGYGIYVTRNAKLDVFPNFVQPQVVIQTECPGLAAEQVELLVTLPIEATVNGIGDMESLVFDNVTPVPMVGDAKTIWDAALEANKDSMLLQTVRSLTALVVTVWPLRTAGDDISRCLMLLER